MQVNDWVVVAQAYVLICTAAAPLALYLWLGSRIRHEVRSGQLETPSGIGSRYATFLLSAGETRMAVHFAVLLQLPFSFVWVAGLMTWPNNVLGPSLFLIPFWIMAVARPFIRYNVPDVDELNEETLMEFLDAPDPVREAAEHMAAFEQKYFEHGRVRKRLHTPRRNEVERYLRVKQDLMARDDELGRVFREAYRQLETGSRE